MIDRGTLRVDDSEFTRNGLVARTAIGNEPCPPLRGGAIYFESQYSTLQVSRSRFQHNMLEHAGYDAQLAGGGQSYLQQGAAIWIEFLPGPERSMNITHCTFEGNTPSGAIWWQRALLDACTGQPGTLQEEFLGDGYNGAYGTIHGGHDTCMFCGATDPEQCPPSLRRQTWSGALHAVREWGRVLDNSPEPQDFGWW
eukprot:COSAG06_NODE_7289_length_2558_cov_1.646198_2_plen_197_part_00